MNKANPSQMVVEGIDDLFSVVGLMHAHVDWPQRPQDPPVYINVGKSVDEILQRGYLDGFLKGSVVKVLGVLIDADTDPRGRYQGIRGRCLPFFPGMPNDIPEAGLIVENDGKRLGVWIMPDNKSPGNMETFLRFLVPNQDEPVWMHAVESMKRAKSIGCKCHDCHIDKANLYTWLAWQEPPSQNAGRSLTQKILDPTAAVATPFVTWFRGLYNLPPRTTLFP